MNNENTFSYTYSTSENQEVLNIRKKYLPQEETKLEELKRLDRLVQSSGVAEALVVGVIGCLIFGLGMCLCMNVIGNAMWLGVILGMIGTGSMIFAYPVYRTVFQKNKQKYAPQILALSEQIMKG